MPAFWNCGNKTPTKQGYYPVLLYFETENCFFARGIHWNERSWERTSTSEVFAIGPQCEYWSEAELLAIENNPWP